MEGGERRRRRGAESRLESISQLRHQCFTVGTLLIALLYNYSTSTPSFWLLHQSVSLAFSCPLSPLCLFFAIFIRLFVLHAAFFPKHTLLACQNQPSDTLSVCVLMACKMYWHTYQQHCKATTSYTRKNPDSLTCTYTPLHSHLHVLHTVVYISSSLCQACATISYMLLDCHRVNSTHDSICNILGYKRLKPLISWGTKTYFYSR